MNKGGTLGLRLFDGQEEAVKENADLMSAILID
jgi:hypothetical protein